ncbi:alpha/beta hydrolase [Kordiimonas marina]|uniref:alpha/beta hydrolase n=1 Tax=Kordiimonas marina TaxID=2872312 RepID=UPI001FF303C8|nr:alpha/beta hydrolase [Kordiimonas marina]MCJ9428021.1 alpha/beta hydrolase [Kordiimonas marina]
MPDIDPETRVFLDQLNSADGPEFDSLTVAEKRAGLDAFFADAAPSAPKADVVDIDIPVRAGRTVSASVFSLPGKEARLPVLFLIQGGGWALAGRAAYGPLARLLADRLGRVVVVADFRLAPEHPFPAGLEDCIDVYKWVRAHAGEIGGDAERIALMGDSAGGNLAAALCLSDEVSAAERPEALVLAYPMTDIRPDAACYASRRELGGGDYFLTTGSIDWSAEVYTAGGTNSGHPLVSVICNDQLGRLPLTLVLTAGLDPLKDEGRIFCLRAVAGGANAVHREYAGTIHGFLSFFHVLPVAYEALADIAAFLRT